MEAHTIQGPQPPRKRTGEVGVSPNLYELISKVGEGSFAKVYTAHHVTTRQVFALKAIAKEKLGDAKLQENLQSEISIMRDYVCEHVVRLYDHFNQSRYIYLVLEYCAGGDLSKFIKRRGRLSEGTAKGFLAQLAAGLAFLDSKSLIHRDLKPANVLLSDTSDSPVLKIADFGFARHLDEASMAQTQCGTPLYMAPEVFKNSYDARADIWSVGCIYYEMLVGTTPWKGRSLAELMQNIETQGVRVPDGVHISHASLFLLQRMLERNYLRRLSLADFRAATRQLNESTAAPAAASLEAPVMANPAYASSEGGETSAGAFTSSSSSTSTTSAMNNSSPMRAAVSPTSGSNDPSSSLSTTGSVSGGGNRHQSSMYTSPLPSPSPPYHPYRGGSNEPASEHITAMRRHSSDGINQGGRGFLQQQHQQYSPQTPQRSQQQQQQQNLASSTLSMGIMNFGRAMAMIMNPQGTPSKEEKYAHTSSSSSSSSSRGAAYSSSSSASRSRSVSADNVGTDRTSMDNPASFKGGSGSFGAHSQEDDFVIIESAVTPWRSTGEVASNSQQQNLLQQQQQQQQQQQYNNHLQQQQQQQQQLQKSLEEAVIVSSVAQRCDYMSGILHVISCVADDMVRDSLSANKRNDRNSVAGSSPPNGTLANAWPLPSLQGGSHSRPRSDSSDGQPFITMSGACALYLHALSLLRDIMQKSLTMSVTPDTPAHVNLMKIRHGLTTLFDQLLNRAEQCQTRLPIFANSSSSLPAPEPILYKSAHALAREAHVEELLGNLARAQELYKTAKILTEALILTSQDANDRRMLHSLAIGFGDSQTNCELQKTLILDSSSSTSPSFASLLLTKQRH